MSNQHKFEMYVIWRLAEFGNEHCQFIITQYATNGFIIDTQAYNLYRKVSVIVRLLYGCNKTGVADLTIKELKDMCIITDKLFELVRK